MAERCPTCGSPVDVYTGGEGTSSFEPVLPDELRSAALHAHTVLLAPKHGPRYFAAQRLYNALRSAGVPDDAFTVVRTGSPTSQETT